MADKKTDEAPAELSIEEMRARVNAADAAARDKLVEEANARTAALKPLRQLMDSDEATKLRDGLREQINVLTDNPLALANINGLLGYFDSIERVLTTFKA